MVKEEEVILDKEEEAEAKEEEAKKEEKVDKIPKAEETPSDKDESPDRFRRAPAQLVKIKELKPEMKRVCVAGTVVSKNDDLYSFLIDDGEGKVLVLTNDADRFKTIEVGQFIRVFAKIWGEGDEIELQADVVQDFSKIDKDLYMKLF